MDGETIACPVETRGKEPADRFDLVRTELIPLQKAAKWIVLANVLAACYILTAGCPVGEEAVATTRAARVEPVDEAICQLGAHAVPLSIAAEKIVLADQSAGVVVLATRCPVGREAVACTWMAGIESIVRVAFAKERNQSVSLITFVSADANHVRFARRCRKHDARSWSHLSTIVVAARDRGGGRTIAVVVHRHFRVIAASAQAGDNKVVACRGVAEPDVGSHLRIVKEITHSWLVWSICCRTHVAE